MSTLRRRSTRLRSARYSSTIYTSTMSPQKTLAEARSEQQKVMDELIRGLNLPQGLKSISTPIPNVVKKVRDNVPDTPRKKTRAA